MPEASSFPFLTAFENSKTGQMSLSTVEAIIIIWYLCYSLTEYKEAKIAWSACSAVLKGRYQCIVKMSPIISVSGI